ncbi:hypothetical protein B0H17DRAFT_1003217 [Mycena rosella]|uniref:Uncharacterized protein n=1 Tax=Mycena rosella TaxID=1033263 RepID=A0AAD7GRX9_MYCRO|nr:hypothetical protein B0H17DRAFT_1003217 [Mycena rosella]
MLCVVVYLYATSLTLWALNVTFWFKNAHAFFMDYPSMPLPDRKAQANLNVMMLGTPMEALFMFNMVVGDSVVIWRAWVLYQRTLWVVSIPCLALLMSFIFTVVDITCLTGAGWGNQSAIAGGGPVCAHAELTSWAFSFVTNATCTILIGFKAWRHRRTMKSLNTLENNRRMSTHKLLSVLVESGFIYCLFWLTQLILFIDVSRDKPIIYVYQLFAGMGDQISGMYPTLIIVIVNFHQTIWEPDSSLPPPGAVSSVQWSSGSKRSGPATTFFSQRGIDVHLGADSNGEITMGDMGLKRPDSEDV